MEFGWWQLWLVAGIILILVEIFTPGFVLACFGIACIITGLVGIVINDLAVQLLIFAMSSLGVLLAIRPLVLKNLSRQGHHRTNTSALIGKSGLVTVAINPGKQLGRVKVGGDDWMAVTSDLSQVAIGEQVEVVEVEGVKLIVKHQPHMKNWN